MSFDNSGKPSRGLPFPLREPETFSFVEATGSVTHLTPDIFPPDSDEKINIVLNLSLNEFVALASSIDVGSDIAYGDNRNLIWWTWVRSFIGLAATMSCEYVADCVESELAGGNTELITQIFETTIDNGFGDTNRVNATQTKFSDRNPPLSLQEPVLTLLNCDLNTLWGGLRYGIVERADDDVRNVLESLAAISSIPDRLIEFLELIPVLGDLAQASLDLATEAIPTLLTLFNSYSSLDNMDDYACGLFGIVCADCRYPTFEELWNYNKSFGITSMPEMAAAVLQSIMDAVTGSTESASQIAYFTLMNFRLGVLYLQAQFVNKTGTAALLHDASLGEDFGNDNWITLCDTCNEDYMLWTWDFTTQGQGDFYPDTTQNTSKAIFIPGDGWQAVNHGSGRRMDVAFKHNPAWEIRAVAYDIEYSSADTAHNWIRRPNWGSTTSQVLSSAGSSGTVWSYYYDGYASLSGINEIVFFAQFAAGVTATLKKVSVLYNTGFSNSPSTPTTDLTPYT